MKGDLVAQETEKYTFIGVSMREIAEAGRVVDYTKLESALVGPRIFVGFKLGWPSNTNAAAVRAKEQAVHNLTGLEPTHYTLYITTTLVED